MRLGWMALLGVYTVHVLGNDLEHWKLHSQPRELAPVSLQSLSSALGFSSSEVPTKPIE